MPVQRIQQHFIDGADLQYQCAEPLARPVADAVQALLACITNAGKVLSCGTGISACQARMFAGLCVAGLERTRPELPALALDNYDALIPPFPPSPPATPDAEGTTHLARQVRALGQPGDVLLAITSTPGGNDVALLHAIATAHERDMTVIALTPAIDSVLAACMHETDVLIAVPHTRPARVREIHTLILHCLCDGIDRQLLGDPEETP